jgi:lipopolysaccharide transport system ATP-binding protein
VSHIIRVDNLSKSYRLGQIGTGTLAQDLGVWWARLRGKPDPSLPVGVEEKADRRGQLLWALRDVSFDVDQGEVLGIIGRNGAGKSTLLKVLSEVTAPTRGEARINGRIGSLLEIGTGFHPDLTGRENIYLNGAILGMSRAEIRRKLDAIVDFSEVEQFIDTPVKRFSSGMYVRLAFAVAVHLEPEILVVDEVLAVGDAQFQRKCLAKMGLIASEGRTILFVSHNMIALQSICQRALWLDAGRIRAHGDASQVVGSYLGSGMHLQALTERRWTDAATAPGNETVKLQRISIQPEEGKPGDLLTLQTALRLEVDYYNLLPDAHLHARFFLYNEQGILAFSSGALKDSNNGLHTHPQRGHFRSVCHIPARLLNAGSYRIDLLLARLDSNGTFAMEDAMSFELVEHEKREVAFYGHIPGVIRPELSWETTFLGE